MTDNDVLRLTTSDDVRMMATPDLWPLGWVLPLANKVTDEIGVLVLHAQIKRTEVFKVNLYDPRMRALVQGDPGNLSSEIYESFEHAFEKGWRVA